MLTAVKLFLKKLHLKMIKKLPKYGNKDGDKCVEIRQIFAQNIFSYFANQIKLENFRQGVVKILK